MMTKAFALNGAAKVYIIGRRKEKLDEAAQLSPNIISIIGDVTSKDSLCQIAEQIKNETGYVNLLCCNSGYMPPAIGLNPTQVSVQQYARKALEQETGEWEKTFATNSVSVAFNTFAFLELLDAGNKQGNCEGRKSQVLVTSSIAGYLRNPGNFGAYPASKAGMCRRPLPRSAHRLTSSNSDDTYRQASSRYPSAIFHPSQCHCTRAFPI
jgi:NAD(P)-dependent dehydrogenase (short-subunit alcohol dehydrogenase family)